MECNRLLLIACQRRQSYLREIELIKSQPNSYQQRKGKGSLTISDIQLPVKRDFMKKLASGEGNFLIFIPNVFRVVFLFEHQRVASSWPMGMHGDV